MSRDFTKKELPLIVSIFMALLVYVTVSVIAVQHYVSADHPFRGQPEQIHLSYGGQPSIMWVTWVTQDPVGLSMAQFGEIRPNTTVDATTKEFIDGGTDKRDMFMHRAKLEHLIPGKTYLYRVGSKWGYSALYFFRALKPTDEGYRFAVYGDLGNKNPQSLARIQTETQMGHFDMILHVGDMAYNMFDDQAQFGDQFMRQIEPIAAYVPYMVIAGNHENTYNFSNYANRFTMPNYQEYGNHFYSFDLGLAHIIGFSTEFYYFTNFGTVQLYNQYKWLVDDLKKASANRVNVPWIITMGHRPMYCSDWDRDDCTKYSSRIRSGMPDTKDCALETLFYEHGVDLELWAHEHSYERLWPVYNRTIFNGSSSPYVDPAAPVHIITGSAGCQELTDPFMPHLPPWSAAHSSQYGYSRMQITNRTHLHFEQVSDDEDGKVIDSMWLVRNKHTNYDMHHSKSIHKHGRGHYVSENWRHPQD